MPSSPPNKSSPNPARISKLNRCSARCLSALRFFTRLQDGHRTSKTPVFSKTPFFTLLLPYFHPTFTLPPNRHHRFRPQRRRFRPLHSSLSKIGSSGADKRRRETVFFFNKLDFHSGFTPDLPRICPASVDFMMNDGKLARMAPMLSLTHQSFLQRWHS